MSNVKALLIGGAGRTGTNVLKDILACHPGALALPFESRFTVDPDGVAHTLKSLRDGWTPFQGEKCLERHLAFLRRLGRRSLPDRLSILGDQLLKKSGIAAQIRPYSEWELEKHFPGYSQYVDELEKDLAFIKYKGIWPGTRPNLFQKPLVIPHSDIEQKATKAFQNFLFKIYSEALKKHKKSFYVDDNTFNALYADELLRVMPGAKLINVVRDPRDATSSYLRQRWTPSEIPQAAQYHKEVVNTWRNLRNTIDSRNYIEIRLEDLTSNPGLILQKICDLSEIPFSDQLLQISLNKANIGRWAQDIPEEWHPWLNDTFEDILKDYGYN